jgi:hypothetical protein
LKKFHQIFIIRQPICVCLAHRTRSGRLYAASVIDLNQGWSYVEALKARRKWLLYFRGQYRQINLTPNRLARHLSGLGGGSQKSTAPSALDR